MPASLVALADDLDTANDEFQDAFTRGSHLSSLSCDSVQIHRSTQDFDVCEKIINSRRAAMRTADNQTGALTAAFPRLVVAEPASVTDKTPTEAGDTDRDSSTSSRVQWTTPEGIQDGLEGALNSGISDIDGILAPDIQQRKPFHKWVKALSRRRIARRHLRRLEKSDQTRSETSNRMSRSSVSRRNSSSISSFAYVSAARDASISGAGTSLAPSSRRHQARSSKRLSKTDRSSRASYSARQSEDDQLRTTQAELETLERSKHRRRIIEELMETEEGYIGDVKFLMKAYLTLFASSSLAEPGFRLSMYSSLTDIVELHDQILGSLHRAVPNSEYVGIPPMSTSRSSSPSKIQRRRSLDVVPEDRTKGLPLYEHSGLSAGPQTAAAVANIFTKIKNQLFVYEEYGAKYGMVMNDLKMMYRSNPHWEKHQRGLENMASMLSYPRAASGTKRALSIGDLFAKPIQRACRYPLLFRELLKATPVYDCPHAHVEIEKALSELESVAKAMNEATDDPLIKSTLQKTWLLQERLRFPSEATGASRSRVRSFGRIELCGVLHVCWQSESSVEGRYMVIILYRNWLCLATAEKTEKKYTLRACIPLHNSSVEEADNGRGLQCHSAPYSWKIAFECSRQFYEILVTAGNQTEEREWRRRLDRHSIDGYSLSPENASFEFLDLDMKSLGTVFSYQGTAKRKPSMRRMTTMPMPKAAMCQVILNNTCTGKETTKATLKHAAIKRSKSVQVGSRIPVLSPPRGERAQLESLIADVWTRDVILCTGLAARPKLGHHRRPSASSIMRRMSVVSLTGTFSRKSASTTSFRVIERVEQETPRQAQPIDIVEIGSTARDQPGFKPYDGQTKTGQVDVTVHERTSSDVSTSFDRPGEHSYFLTVTSPEQMAYSLQQRRHQPGPTATVVNAPRSSVTRFIEEMGPRIAPSAYPERAGGEAHSEIPMSPSMPDLSHHGSLSTAEISMSSSTAKMMSPLTQQPRQASSTRQGRHWLGRPLLHRKSFRRTAKETQH